MMLTRRQLFKTLAGVVTITVAPMQAGGLDHLLLSGAFGKLHTIPCTFRWWRNTVPNSIVTEGELREEMRKVYDQCRSEYPNL